MKRYLGCFVFVLVVACMIAMLVIPLFDSAHAETIAPAIAPTVDLTPIFQAVIALISALICYRLVPWIKARTTDQQQRNMTALVSTLVYAAEQVYGAGRGAEKLQYVMDALAESGYDVDGKAVAAEVEAAVKLMQAQLLGNVFIAPQESETAQNGAD